jgi:hypothetical protein
VCLLLCPYDLAVEIMYCTQQICVLVKIVLSWVFTLISACLSGGGLDCHGATEVNSVCNYRRLSLEGDQSGVGLVRFNDGASTEVTVGSQCSAWAAFIRR